MKITISAETGSRYARFIRDHLKKAHAHLVAWASRPCPKNMAETAMLRRIDVILINDKQMSALHQQFMNIPGTTDVITFPLDETSGEIYLCVPLALRQSKIRAVEPKFELLLYAIHGMLHLLGYDDKTTRAYRTMHHIEDQLLTQLGIGPVFARPAFARPALSRGAR